MAYSYLTLAQPERGVHMQLMAGRIREVFDIGAQ
jgi:hypothetical protein